MVKFEKLTKEKPGVIIHKLYFVARKRAQKFIDTHVKVGKAPRFSVRNTRGYRKINPCRPDITDQKDRDCILKRSFFWLGMKGEEIKQDIWNEDFLSDYIWKNQYFQSIVTVDPKNTAEVKVPWELSRWQHISRLAMIYSHSHESKLLKFIVNETKSWIENNPYKHSVNWTCAMEVGIRAINMILIALLIPDDLFQDGLRFETYITCLMQHGMYIRQNLETYDEYYNNHYLSDLLGLQWISLFCEEHLLGKDKETAKRWYLFAKHELQRESNKQIFSDGTDYESSIAYHRYVTELFYLSVYIDKVFGHMPEQEIVNHVEGMTSFLEAIRKPDGSLPMIGDSDDGRIIILENYSKWDKLKTDYIFEHKTQLLNGRLELPMDSIPAIENRSIAFSDSGYYILRNNNIYCMTHCGPLSLHGHGGHSHNDQLAVILCFNKQSFVVDSGTGSYSGYPELRNYFRSTRAHSTLEAIGVEQNELIKDSLYMMRERSFSKCLDYNEGFFSGNHRGFELIGIIHKRNIRITNSGVLIDDYIEGEHIDSSQQWQENYILDSDVVPIQISEKIISLQKNGVVVTICSNIPITICSAIISKQYGKTEESYKLKSSSTNIKHIHTEFVLGGI